MYAVALAPGEDTNLLLLITPGEVEAGNIAAGIDQLVTKHHLILATGNLLKDRLVAIERTVLINVSEFNRITDLEAAAIWLFLAGNHAKQGGFTGTVGSDDADDPTGR